MSLCLCVCVSEEGTSAEPEDLEALSRMVKLRIAYTPAEDQYVCVSVTVMNLMICILVHVLVYIYMHTSTCAGLYAY